MVLNIRMELYMNVIMVRVIVLVLKIQDILK